jgi:hypothetical protein
MKRSIPPEKSSRTSTGDPRRSTPWHAVSIVTGNSCCGEAQAVRGIRFLSAQAPRLPLAKCPLPGSCVCYYKHHADRRAQPRRRDDVMGLRRRGYTADERRVDFGRREDD